MNYYEYNPHSETQSKEEIPKRDYLQIISIDPAIGNYAIRIERRYSDIVETGFFEKFNFSDPLVEKSTELLTLVLQRLEKHIINCDLVLVEKQMSINYKATRIAQNTLTEIRRMVKDNERRTRIFELSPKIKNLILKKKKGENHKALSVKRAREILEKRKDTTALSILNNNRKKQDDLCDTICQLEGMLIELKLEDGL